MSDVVAGLLSAEESQRLARTVLSSLTTASDATVAVDSDASGATSFARNEIQGGKDATEHVVHFWEKLGAYSAAVSTNDVGEASLKAVVIKADALGHALTVPEADGGPPDPPRAASPINPRLWSSASAALLAPEARVAFVQSSLAAVEKAGLVGAGAIETSPHTSAVLTRDGHFEYGRTSTCTYSITARTKDGSASGWAAWVGEDWSAAQPDALAERAIDLANRSRNPVAVEPGRYTVVMSPEACGELVRWIAFVLDGEQADAGRSPFSRPEGGSKLGLRVLDERVTLSADPMDPDGGFLPFEYAGRLVQYAPVVWIEHGVLETLAYSTRAAAAAHGLDPHVNNTALRMAGGPTSLEEMIASTTRGIYVTRFSEVFVVSWKTLYLTGVTRDGTFLIEHGKITRPIKNMRFEDSPMFFLNNLEALGPAKRVAVGYAPYVMPCVKVRDFAFTSLTEAV